MIGCAVINCLNCKVVFGCILLHSLMLCSVQVSEYLDVRQFTFAHTGYAARPHTVIQAAPFAVLEEYLDVHFGDLGKPVFGVGLCVLQPSGEDNVDGICNVCSPMYLEVVGGAVVCGEAALI
jgi:hypothetical protein